MPSTSTREIVNSWVAGWNGEAPEPWVDLFSSRAKYTDHAFLIVRIGSKTLSKHWAIWHHSIPDFKMELTSVWPEQHLADDKVRVTIRTKNSGTLVNNLPSKKATGKEFSFAGVVDLLIDSKSGLIEEVEEWYSSNFELATSVQDYNLRADGGASL